MTHLHQGAIAPARPEQNSLLVPIFYIDIINGALRNAALAPTDVAALDIAGDALRLLVDIARAEVRHG
ncbi:hypothetical protein P9292_11030 [Caballeronia sp. LZ001]|nr:hypothetical protein [Caballeronia sp. LZ001]